MKSGTNLRPLEVVTSEKDLGITFDRILHFTEHIEKCSSKANQRIGLIRRNMDEKLFIVLYKALIRPVLEYTNVVWKPYFKDSELLERVQRCATKLVKSVRNESYPVRLKRLNLPSLVFRRKRTEMIQLYRIMTGITCRVVSSSKWKKELQEVIYLKLSSQGLLVRLKETPLDIWSNQRMEYTIKQRGQF